MDQTTAAVVGRDGELDLVEVWNEFTQRWTIGFVALDTTSEGVLVRRDGDRTPLSAAIPADRVRPLRVVRPQAGDQRVSRHPADTAVTAVERAAVGG